MYEAFFGFNKRPFAAAPQPDQYFPGKAIQAARQTLVRCIQRAEGPGLVIGPAGAGKTLLLQLVADQFQGTFAVALLSSGGLGTRRGLLQAILFELGQPYRGMDEGELRLALTDYLTLGEKCPRGIVLLVDEAHTLPLRLLEEMRIITNVAVRGQPRTRLVLAGAPALEERLASPKLESFSQRLAARCYLEAFNRAETQAYVHAAIQAAGGAAEEILPPDACHSVYQATNGVPRLINQVCDHALLLAYTAGRHEVSAACIEEAWADLQQLPTPWSDSKPADQAAGGVIEFGNLEDEPAPSAGTPGADGAAGDDGSATEEDLPSPVLCVTRGPDEPLPEPVERLEQIEQALNTLDEDFQPAGSIGPEVELVFDEPNPFSEQFEEEEMIVDRYAPIGSTSVVPQTTDAQGTAKNPPAVDAQPVYAAGNVFCAQVPALGAVAWSGQASGAAAEATRPAKQPQSPAGWDAQSPTLPLRRGPPDAAAEPDDADMIIVEDSYEKVEPPHVRPVTAVRRHEYKQLFARLRRG